MKITPMPKSLPLLALLFVGAGVMHFARPIPYIGIVPPVFPGAALLVAISGVAEIIGGFTVLFVPLRRVAGLGLILLLIAIFPANIYMLSLAITEHRSALWQAALWLRLPLQPLLIWWVWRVAVVDGEYRE